MIPQSSRLRRGLRVNGFRSRGTPRDNVHRKEVGLNRTRPGDTSERVSPRIMGNERAEMRAGALAFSGAQPSAGEPRRGPTQREPQRGSWRRRGSPGSQCLFVERRMKMEGGGELMCVPSTSALAFRVIYWSPSHATRSDLGVSSAAAGGITLDKAAAPEPAPATGRPRGSSCSWKHRDASTLASRSHAGARPTGMSLIAVGSVIRHV
ncbi:hypothetical protein AAFF_G00418290 [Aldrovandia affinis]|uniref:Uncharacterized protein n=1 Tax=Aldrovandia affinis TaxID=143900 RepID=A0AAD7WJ45_9TELE|nr:hypothetical protein AAFF_G00418290 [Aldrovandia affinis]